MGRTLWGCESYRENAKLLGGPSRRGGVSVLGMHPGQRKQAKGRGEGCLGGEACRASRAWGAGSGL